MRYTINIKRAEDAPVWIATSEDILGLVVEADTFDGLLKEIELIVPDLLELNGQEKATAISYIPDTFVMACP